MHHPNTHTDPSIFHIQTNAHIFFLLQVECSGRGVLADNLVVNEPVEFQIDPHRSACDATPLVEVG